MDPGTTPGPAEFAVESFWVLRVEVLALLQPPDLSVFVASICQHRAYPSGFTVWFRRTPSALSPELLSLPFPYTLNEPFIACIICLKIYYIVARRLIAWLSCPHKWVLG